MVRPGPRPVWTPPPVRAASSRLGRWLERLRAEGTLAAPDYDQAWAWSVTDPDGFWLAAGDELGIDWARRPSRAVVPPPDGGVEGARWFPDGRLNYARQALEPVGVAGGDVAVLARSQTRPPSQLTWDQLGDLVGRTRAGLAAAGVRRGDRVAGYLPNIPEALVAMLATASLGAVWTCCAPETGVSGVLDRLAQVAPTVLLGVDGYRWGGRRVDRSEELAAIRAGLPSVRTAVLVRYLDPAGTAPAGWATWEELTADGGAPDYEEVAADHPLYVLYSSGTTGKPKAIVHGHGGIVAEHTKALGFHFDVGAGDRLYWYTTTGWMMWNFLVSGLLVGAAVVLHDGEPGDAWSVMAATRTTCGGLGAAALVAAQRSGARPGVDHDLTALRTLGSTGSPLPAATAEWFYAEAGLPEVALGSFSGGTDVCTGFVGPSPLHPVWPGEIACRCLGAAVAVFDDGGSPVLDTEGELVLTAPLPSMPVGFWGDDDGRRYHDAYFGRFPGVWAHGDRMTLTSRGTCVITGRSDGTLNRGGVRMGTAEFYDVVEADAAVADSLVVHVEDAEGGPGRLWLFVVPAAGDGHDGLDGRLRDALRTGLSPRHVPDEVVLVEAIPRTLSGKKLEVPVKRILAGARPDDVVTRASVANPDALDAIAAARCRPSR